MSDIEIYRQLDQRADINCDMDATGIGILATVLSGPILLLVLGVMAADKSRESLTVAYNRKHGGCQPDQKLASMNDMKMVRQRSTTLCVLQPTISAT